LETALVSISGEIVLVAHSLGCLVPVWWAATGSPSLNGVRAVMLVAPPDLASAPGCLPALASFTPVPRRELPWPSLLVASETDPYATIGAAASMANDWGSAFINAGRVGHINVDSGVVDWPEGERYLADFLDTLHMTGSWRSKTAGEIGIERTAGAGASCLTRRFHC